MASYTTNLKNWGATGTEFPDGYNYLEGEQPVDDWDNWLTDQLIGDIKDHLIPLTNSRIESDYGTSGGEPGTPETSHLYHDQDNERLELWDAAAAKWRDIMFRDGDTMTGALDMGNYPISGVTSFEADSQVLLDPTSGSLTDGGSVDSNSEVLRGYYDSDGTTSISATAVDATLQHVANADGSSVLDARVQATDVLRAYSTGKVGVPNGELHLSSALQAEEITTPSTPSTGNKLYFKSDDQLHKLDDAGTEQQISSDIQGLIDSPNQTFPVAFLEDTESIEVAIPVPDTETLTIYRWGVYKIADGTAPTGLEVQLLDDADTVQASASVVNNENTAGIASYSNTSGTLSIFKIRLDNATGNNYNTDGVGGHAAYKVE